MFYEGKLENSFLGSYLGTAYLMSPKGIARSGKEKRKPHTTRKDKRKNERAERKGREKKRFLKDSINE